MNQIDYTEWKDTLTNYKNEMLKELAEVRKAKQELYEMQRQLQELAIGGRYERDENVLYLSAPTIVIGNIDKNGNLLNGPSKVIIRSNDIELDGVGQVSGSSVTGGSVVTRARKVEVQTVDPGPDGRESVAFPDSSFTVQSASFGVVTEEVAENGNNGGVFTLNPTAKNGSISIGAEKNIDIKSTVTTNNTRVFNGMTKIKVVPTAKLPYSDDIDTAIKTVDTMAKTLHDTQEKSSLNLLGAAGDEADLLALRTGLYKFEERTDVTESATLEMSKAILKGTALMSNMAEVNRIYNYLSKRFDAIKENKNKETESHLNLNSAVINIATINANGELSKDPNNGLNINTQHTSIMAVQGTTPVEGSTFVLKTGDVLIDTSTYKYEEVDKKLVPKECTAAGNFLINSQKIDIQTMDKEFEGSGENLKTKTSTISAESIVKINTNQVNLDMTGSDGKALGKFNVNAKDINITSYDIGTDGNPTARAEGGTILMGSQTVTLGSPDDSLVCDHVQIAGRDTAIFGNESVSILKETGGSQLILNDNAELSGKEVKLVGEITLGGATKIDAEFTAGDIKAKNVTASQSISGPNIKDGTSLSSGGSETKPTKPAERDKKKPEKTKIIEEKPSFLKLLGFK